MNLRHAAVLALVGWYLMVPPVNKTGDHEYGVDFGSALSKWAVNAAFDKASNCNALAGQMSSMGLKDLKKYPASSFKWALADMWTQCQCIATDDPRLAK